MFQKYIVPVIGVGAFIVGGLVAQEKALEVVGTISKALNKKSSQSL